MKTFFKFLNDNISKTVLLHFVVTVLTPTATRWVVDMKRNYYSTISNKQQASCMNEHRRVTFSIPTVHHRRRFAKNDNENKDQQRGRTTMDNRFESSAQKKTKTSKRLYTKGFDMNLA